jgi:two-component system, sensor histidine kinase SagS
VTANVNVTEHGYPQSATFRWQCGKIEHNFRCLQLFGVSPQPIIPQGQLSLRRSLGLSDLPKILCVSDPDSGPGALAFQAYDVDYVGHPVEALQRLATENFAGICYTSDRLSEAVRLGQLLQNEQVLDGMPDGVVLLDADNTIRWSNQRFLQWTGHEDLVGQSFYSSLGSPEILGPDFCPFHTALATGMPSNSTLRAGDHHYYQIHAAPVLESVGLPKHLVVTIRDVSAEVLQQQKLAAIHKAGMELADLKPEEIFHMGVEERIELVKSNILHYTQDLLNFDVVEIRLLDPDTGELVPLLAVGLDPDSQKRRLFARPQNNGVTGFVAATGKSYLCEDTREDPLYLEGFKGARSSLTVPLILHDQVIGSFNVESPDTRAFTESDLQFLEIFSRDMAVALNTLELLVAQKANAAQESVEAIHSAVALPVDEILNDAVNVMERYIGHEPEVVRRLQRILRNARDIKQVIQKVGQKMTPAQAVPASVQAPQRPNLRMRRILVVDADEAVRNDAHALLERYGCIVETAHEGGEAIFMVRSCAPDEPYDVIIADIRLPDMNGYELLLKLKTVLSPVPMILMTGFGYDPGHSIVNARQAGLHPKGVLYKPFRLDQLVETVEKILEFRGNHSTSTSSAT